jgi:hypothetical protein
VAFDVSEDEAVVLWKDSVAEKLQTRPSKKFNFGMIPGAFNLVFSIEENDFGVRAMQFYTRIYHQIHRDENR